MRQTARAGLVLGMALGIALAACGGDAAGPPAPARVAVYPDRLELHEGEEGLVIAQVVDPGGAVLPGQPPLSSTAPEVASVSADGVVGATHAGDAWIVATYGAMQASIPVSVSVDRRFAMSEFDVLPQEVEVSLHRPEPLRVPYRAVNGIGRSICNEVALSFESDSRFAVGVNRTRSATDCLIEIQPVRAGRTMLYVRAPGFTDSVRVEVTAPLYDAYFLVAPPRSTVATGSTQRFVVMAERLGTQSARIAFSASAGRLSVDTVRMGSGTIDVDWTLPSHLGLLGGDHKLTLVAQFPDGTTATDERWLHVAEFTPGPTRSAVFFQKRGDTWYAGSRFSITAVATPYTPMPPVVTFQMAVAGFDDSGLRTSESFVYQPINWTLHPYPVTPSRICEDGGPGYVPGDPPSCYSTFEVTLSPETVTYAWKTSAGNVDLRAVSNPDVWVRSTFEFWYVRCYPHGGVCNAPPWPY